MPQTQDTLICPHCGQQLQAFEMPEASGWDDRVQWACFNNDCSYYREGWDWMWNQYEVKVSYRYRVVDPDSGQASPLAVWSDSALLDCIVKKT
ncbi:MAG: hypothetical protein JRJ19_00380 [Deltaproteobacteria bacterium]|nr:hypothetical protein [Deltaproteobacteria bacterium]MBW1870487.1 hypothetical protein [Deltaproteobacteria bacterium]